MDDDKRVYTHQEALISEMLGDLGKLYKDVKTLCGIIPVEIERRREFLDVATEEFRNQAEAFLNNEVDRVEKAIRKETEVSAGILALEASKTSAALQKEVQRVVSSLPLNQSKNAIIGLCLGCSVATAIITGGVIYIINSNQQQDILNQQSQILELLQKGNRKK